MLAAVTWLSAAFIVHCVTCGIELANSFQLCITNEIYGKCITHTQPPVYKWLKYQQFNSQELCGT